MRNTKALPLTTPGTGGRGMHSSHWLLAASLVPLGIINIRFSHPGKSDSKRESHLSKVTTLTNLDLSSCKEGFLTFLS